MSNYNEHDKVSAIRYSEAEITTNDYIEYNPEALWRPKVDAGNIAYHSLFEPFNLEQFLYPRPPIDMGLVDDIPYIETNVLRMPLKFPGTKYKIPEQLSNLQRLICMVAEYEAFINPEHNDCFCHITYDYSILKPGHYHRFPGFHGDGLQGTKLTPKTKAEHSYIWTTDPGTEFCLQPFFLKHLDEAKHNFFYELDRQAKEVNIYKSLPDHLYLIDPYMVHRTPVITEELDRLFVRITYAFTELQHPNNTVNPLFSGQQYEKRADVRYNLANNEFEVPWHLYGLSK